LDSQRIHGSCHGAPVPHHVPYA